MDVCTLKVLNINLFIGKDIHEGIKAQSYI